MYLSVDIASHSSRDANIYRFIIIQLAFASFTGNLLKSGIIPTRLIVESVLSISQLSTGSKAFINDFEFLD